MSKRVLIVFEDTNLRFTYRDVLELEGYETICTTDFSSALGKLQTESIDLVVSKFLSLDSSHKEIMTYLDFQNEARSQTGNPELPFIFIGFKHNQPEPSDPYTKMIYAPMTQNQIVDAVLSLIDEAGHITPSPHDI